MPWSRGDNPVNIVACDVHVTAGKGLVQAVADPSDVKRGACGNNAGVNPTTLMTQTRLPEP
jgi:hypothetical protein